MKTILLVLTLLGAAITTASSVFSATNKLYDEEPSGKRKLRGMGYISIGFTIVGLIITFSSGVLGYQLAKKEAAEKVVAENEKKREAEQVERDRKLEAALAENRLLLGQELQTSIVNAYNKFLVDESALNAQKRELAFTREIILSGQPLRSLQMDWTFSGISKPFAKYMAEQFDIAKDYLEGAEDLSQGLFGERYQEMARLVYRYKTMYPFFEYLIHDREIERSEFTPFLVQLSFDEENSAIFSFGLLDSILADKATYPSQRPYDFSGSVEFAEDFREFETFGVRIENKRTAQKPMLWQDKKNQYSVNWTLDPNSLSSAIDLASARSFISSKLPDRFRITILYDIEKLPFENFNQAKISIPVPFFLTHLSTDKKSISTQHFSGSQIKLKYNGFDKIEGTYDVYLLHMDELKDTFDPPETFCSIKVFECVKR